MLKRQRMVTILKWFGILWTVFAGVVVVVSNDMITKNAPPLMGVLPFETRDNLRMALLLAPSVIAAILLFVLAKKKESDVASRSRSDPGSYPPNN